MLEVFRQQSRSILIYVFFGIIIAVFVINFGPQSQGCGGPAQHQGTAATVAGQELSEGAFHFGWFVYNGPNMRPERARSLRLKERIMSKLIERELFAQEAERRGLHVSERDVEEMLEDGRMVVLGVRQNVRGWIFKHEQFDRTMLERFVQFNLNMSLKRFVDEERREMLAERMRDLLRGAVKVSAEEVVRAYDQEHLKVNLEFVRFDPQKLESAAPTDADIDAFVKDKKKEIEEYYKGHQYEYQGAKPALQLRDIFFKIPPNARGEIVNQRRMAAGAALARIQKGEDFAAVAGALSDDAAAKAKGGDIGWREIGKLELGPDAEAKLATAKAGTLITEPLRAPLGFHVVKVEARRDGSQTLEQAQRDIARKLLATGKTKERAKAMADDTLAKIKAGQKLDALFKKAEKPAEGASQPAPILADTSPKLEETGLFERRGNVVSQLGVSAELAKAAFDAKMDQPVLDKVFEVSGVFVVVRLKERQDPVPAEFEKGKDEITRRQQLQKWGEYLTDWAQKQCVAARDRGKINVNSDLLVYESKTGAAETATFQPCQNVY